MGTNPRSQPHELEHLLQLAEPKFIVTSPDGLPMLRDVISSSENLSSSGIGLCLLDQYAITRLSQILLSDESADRNTTNLPKGGTETDVFNLSSLLEHD